MRSPLAAAAALSALILAASGARAQSVAELQSAYTGRAGWDAPSGTLSFDSSGRVDFGRPNLRATIWEVPPEVKKIEIGRGVRVEAAFTLTASADVEGQGLDSELFGTAEAEAMHTRGFDDLSGLAMTYSAVYATGNGVVINVRGLTSRDPLAYHFTGKGGAVFHLDGVAAIDDRGDARDNSDGISAGKGSTVSNCYFSTGDDVIKVYADITVTDTTIAMVKNAVPVQLGWGSYGDGAVGTFKNLRIIGDSGRGADHAVIAAAAGSYRKTLVFDGLSVQNPTASLFMFADAGADVSVKIDDADVSVARYASVFKASGSFVVCGSDAPGVAYHCASSPASGASIGR